MSSLSDPVGRFLILHMSVKDMDLILVNVYGPNKDLPEFFVNMFAKVDDVGNSRIVLAGDLNITVGPLHYEGSCPVHHNIQAKSCFNMYVEELSLVDVWR